MSSLKDFLADPGKQTPEMRIPAGFKSLPKSMYIAMAMLPKNLLPAFGESFTLPGGGSSITLSSANLVDSLIKLALNGQCWFFGNGSMSGKRGKPTEMMETAIFGSRVDPRPTGEVKETVEVQFKYFYMNREFFNSLRANFAEYDIYFFTNKSVEKVIFDEHEPLFMAVGDEVTGSNTDEIIGGFSVAYTSEGQVIAEFGAFEKQLAISNARYTFDAPAAVTGITASLNNTVFTFATATARTLTQVVAQDVEPGVVAYALFTAAGEPVPTAQLTTINSSTGAITVGAAIPVGRYKYKQVAYNLTGVMGEKVFEFVVTAA